MSSNPFDYLTAINQTKEDMVADEYGEKQYNPFMVNRGLSFFKDTVLFANEMNRNYHLDKALQFTFLNSIVAPRKRFSKWFKAEEIPNLELVMAYYGYSYQRAREVVDILTPEQIAIMKTRLFKGGRN